MSPLVGMPAFTNPNDDTTAGGSINYDPNTGEHPVEHSDDYGDSVNVDAEDSSTDSAETPADREEWTKAHWQTRADELGIARSGNKGEVRDNVEDFEKSVEQAKAMPVTDWLDSIDEIDTADDANKARTLYDLTGLQSTQVEAALKAKEAEFGTGGDNNGS